MSVMKEHTTEFTLSEEGQKAMQEFADRILQSGPAAKAAAAIVDHVKGINLLDYDLRDIPDAILQATIRTIIEAQYGSDHNKVSIVLTMNEHKVEFPPLDAQVAENLYRQLASAGAKP